MQAFDRLLGNASALGQSFNIAGPSPFDYRVAAEYLGLARLGSTDDSGFAPFYDDTRISRETAFAKIRARVEGTVLASSILEQAA